MDRLRAVFDAPKDCSDEQLKRVFYRNGQKFLEAMDKQGGYNARPWTSTRTLGLPDMT